MKTYFLMVKVLGGEWQRFRLGDQDYETGDLAEALGMKETIADPIREVMVISITPGMVEDSDFTLIRRTYELVE